MEQVSGSGGQGEGGQKRIFCGRHKWVAFKLIHSHSHTKSY